MPTDRFWDSLRKLQADPEPGAERPLEHDILNPPPRATGPELSVIAADAVRDAYGLDDPDGSLLNGGKPLDGAGYLNLVRRMMLEGEAAIDPPDVAAWRKIDPADRAARLAVVKKARSAESLWNRFRDVGRAIVGEFTPDREPALGGFHEELWDALPEELRYRPDEDADTAAERGEWFRGRVEEKKARADEDALIAAYDAEMQAKNFGALWRALSPDLEPRALDLARRNAGRKITDPADIEAFEALPEEQAELVSHLVAASRPRPGEAQWGTDTARATGAIMKRMGRNVGRFVTDDYYEGWRGVDHEAYYARNRRRQMLEEANADAPYDEYSFAAKAIMGAVTTLPYMGVAGLPVVGPTLVAMDQFETMRDRLIRAGVPESQSFALQVGSAYAYALLEKVQWGAAFGRPLTTLGRRALFAQVAQRGARAILPMAGKIGAEVAVSTITETVEEALQGVIEDGTFARLTGADWSDVAGDALVAAAREAKESFGSMGVIALAGGASKTVGARFAADRNESLSEFLSRRAAAEALLERRRAPEVGPAAPQAVQKTLADGRRVWARARSDAAAVRQLQDLLGSDRETALALADYYRHEAAATGLVSPAARSVIEAEAPLDVATLIPAAIPGATVRRIGVAPEAETKRTEAADGSFAIVQDVPAAEPAAEVAAPAARPGERLSRRERRLQRDAADVSPAVAAVPAAGAAPAVDAAPAAVEDAGAPAAPASAETYEVTVPAAGGERRYLVELGEPRAPGVDTPQYAASVEEALGGAVTAKQWLEMPADERRALIARHGLAWRGNTSARPVTLTLPDGTRAELAGVVRLVAEREGLPEGTEAATPVTALHEHAHVAFAIARDAGALVEGSERVATLRQMFGAPRPGVDELFNEEAAAEGFGRWSMGRSPDPEGAAERAFAAVRGAVERVLRALGLLPGEPQTRRGAIDAAYNAIVTGDWRNLDAYAGIEITPAPKAEEPTAGAAAATGPAATGPAKPGGFRPPSDPGAKAELASRPKKEEAAPAADEGEVEAAVDASRDASKEPLREARRPGRLESQMAEMREKLEALMEMVRTGAASRPAPRAVSTKKRETAITPQSGVEFEYEWVWDPVEELKSSEDDDYEQDLQNRDRGRVASVEQMARIGTPRKKAVGEVSIDKGFDWPRLVWARQSNTGAPITDGQKQIVAGNGRRTGILLLIARGAMPGSAETWFQKQYYEPVKAWARENGVPVPTAEQEAAAAAAGQHLVLNRRITRMPQGVSLRQIARESNVADIQELATSDKAGSDADLVTPGLMSLYAPGAEGNMLAASNRPFMLKFIDAVGDASLRTGDGLPNSDAVDRVRNALFSYLVGSQAENRALIDFLTEQNEALKNQLRVYAGSVIDIHHNHPEFSLLPFVRRAIADYVRWMPTAKRETLDDFIAQPDIELGTLPPESAALMRLMQAGRLGRVLDAYAAMARMEATQDGAFGLFESRTPLQLIGTAERKALLEGETAVTPDPESAEAKVRSKVEPEPAAAEGAGDTAAGEPKAAAPAEKAAPPAAVPGERARPPAKASVAAPGTLPEAGDTPQPPADLSARPPIERVGLVKTLNTAPHAEAQRLAEKWATIMPGFQGYKREMGPHVLAALLRYMSPQARARFDTLDDWFGGGGNWGIFLALSAFPNIKRARVHELNANRIAKIRLFHERGDQVGGMLASPEMEALLRRAAEAMNADGVNSAGSLADRLDDLMQEGAVADNLRGLVQALADYGRNSYGSGRDEAGNASAAASIAKAKRMVTEQAAEAFRGAEAFRARGGTIEYVEGDSYKADHLAGDNVLSVVDPPYYKTSGYARFVREADMFGEHWNKVDGGIVGIDIFRATRDLLGRLTAAGNGVVYTDEAFWRKPGEGYDAIPSGMRAKYDPEGQGVVEWMLDNLDRYDIVDAQIGGAARNEILGVHHGNRDDARAADEAGWGFRGAVADDAQSPIRGEDDGRVPTEGPVLDFQDETVRGVAAGAAGETGAVRGGDDPVDGARYQVTAVQARPALQTPRTAETARAFGGWSAVLGEDARLRGWRGFKAPVAERNKAQGFGATEGAGIYVAREAGDAEFFGRPVEVRFDMPRNALVVDQDGAGEPLPLLQQKDDVWSRIENEPEAAGDGDWLRAHKRAWAKVGRWDEDALAEALTEEVVALGYDAVHVRSGGQEWAVLLRDQRAELPGGERYQVTAGAEPDALGFYSQLRTVLAAKMPARATAKALRGLTDPAKGSGIKADELRWSGFGDWLDALPDDAVVTRGQALEAARDVALAEDVLQEELDPDARYRRMQEPGGTLFAGNPAYANYTIPGSVPGTYAERLIRLPDVGPYESRHWSGHPNVLLHIRHADRPLPGGGTGLLLEEAQSDWHQEGRERGYGTIPFTQDMELTAAKVVAGQWEVRDVSGRFVTNVMPYDAETAERAIEIARYRIAHGSATAPEGVPPAPFADTSKGWARLAVKRALRVAVERGLRTLLWTPGIVQIRRYEDATRQAVDKIEVLPPQGVEGRGVPGPGHVRVIATKGGGEVFKDDLPLQGSVTRGGVTRSVTDATLEDVIGKEMAAKVRADPDRAHTFEGDDLHIGGEGMVEFYDRILPRIAADLGKRYGAAPRVQPAVDPTYVDGAIEARARGIVDVYEADEMAAPLPETIDQEAAARVFGAMIEGDAANFAQALEQERRYGDADAADAIEEHVKGLAASPALWRLDIPESMASDILRGQPRHQVTAGRPAVLTGYRSAASAEVGAHGTFYSFAGQGRETVRRAIRFERLLEVPQADVEAFEGLPAEALAARWFRGTDFGALADERGIEPGEIMDEMVAARAVAEGYDGIRYGDFEFVDLRGQPRHQVTAERDAEYLAAVESGDMETAQRMVDAAAKAAGYPWHNLQHETEHRGDTIVPGGVDITRSGPGIWLSNYGAGGMAGHSVRRGRGVVRRLHARINKPLFIDGYAQAREVGKRYTSHIDYPKNIAPRARFMESQFPHMLTQVMVNSIKKDGYDGIIFRFPHPYKDGDLLEYVVFDSNQIKSADPVTYRDDGTIIPLSERFNAETPDIRNQVTRGRPKHSPEALLEALLASRILAGKEVTRDEAGKILKNLGAADADPGAVVAAARARAEGAAATALGAAKLSERDLLERLASQADRDRMVARMDAQFREGARYAEPGIDAAVEADRLAERTAKLEIASANGYTAREMQAELGVDLAAATLAMPPRELSDEEKAARAAAREKRRREAEEADAAADLDAAEAAAALRAVDPSPQMSALVDDLLARARARAEAQRLEDQRKRLEKERAAKEGAQDGGADEEGVGAAGEAEDAALGLDEAEVVRLVAPALADPDEFAAFVYEWARRRIAADRPHLAPERLFRDPAALRDLARTAAGILDGLARDLLPYGRTREAALGDIAELAEARTERRVLRQTAFIYSRIQATAQEATRERLIADLERTVTRLAKEPGRFQAGREDMKRRVTASVEMFARTLLDYIHLTPAEIEAETRRLQEVIGNADAEEVATGYATTSDRDFRAAVDQLAVLSTYGGMASWMPGKISDAAETIIEQLSGARAEHEARVAEHEAAAARMAGQLSGAVMRGEKDLQADPTAVDRWADSLIGNLRLRLHHLVRYAHGKIRDDALRVIDDAMVILGDGATAYRIYQQDAHAALNAALADIYGSPAAGVRHLDEPIPEEFRARLARQGAPAMTYGQALQLYGSIIQKDYRDNVRRHGRHNDLPVLRRVLTDADMRLHLWLVGHYAARRESLSAAQQAVTGLPILSPDQFYLPVRVRREPSGFRGRHASWTPVLKSLTPRVRHRLDFDERVSVLDTFADTLEDAALITAYGARGIFLRDLFGREALQGAIERWHGPAARAGLINQVEDTLRGGRQLARVGAYLGPMNKARRWTARFYLSGNAASALKQLASVPVWANVVGFRGLMRYMTDVDVGAVRELMESDAFRARYEGGWSEETANILSATHRSMVARLYDKGLVLNSVMDAAAGIWIAQGLYRDLKAKFEDEGRGADEAKARAQTIVWNLIEETQQSARTENLPQFIREGGGAMRFLTQFVLSPLQQLSFEIEAIREARAGTPGSKAKLARALVINHILVPALFRAISAGWSALLGFEPDDEDERNRWAAIITASVIGQFGGIFLVGNMAEDGLLALLGGTPRYGSGGSLPAESLSQIVVLGGKTLLHAGQVGVNMLAPHDLYDVTTADVMSDLDRLARRLAAPYRHVRQAVENRSED